MRGAPSPVRSFLNDIGHYPSRVGPALRFVILSRSEESDSNSTGPWHRMMLRL